MATETINVLDELKDNLEKTQEVFENACARESAAKTALDAAKDTYHFACAVARGQQQGEIKNAAQNALGTARKRWRDTLDPLAKAKSANDTAQKNLNFQIVGVVLGKAMRSASTPAGRLIRQRLEQAQPGSDMEFFRQLCGEGPAHVVGACETSLTISCVASSCL